MTKAKRFGSAALAAALACGLVFAAAPAYRATAEAADEVGEKAYVTSREYTTDVYRLYDKTRGEHIYTANEVEKAALLDAGWVDEGVAFKTELACGKPVYRLYNPNEGGMHFYTINADERDGLVEAGWTYEGVVFCSSGTTPVYRVYNPKSASGEHHFTTLESEVDDLTALGWNDEKVAWYTDNR